MAPSAVGGQIEVCPRIAVSKLMNGKVRLLPEKYIQDLERNQKIASCCRHPENHDIVALKSNADEKSPDIYKFICPCGRVHTRFMCGDDPRPVWTRR